MSLSFWSHVAGPSPPWTDVRGGSVITTDAHLGLFGCGSGVPALQFGSQNPAFSFSHAAWDNESSRDQVMKATVAKIRRYHLTIVTYKMGWKSTLRFCHSNQPWTTVQCSLHCLGALSFELLNSVFLGSTWTTSSLWCYRCQETIRSLRIRVSCEVIKKQCTDQMRLALWLKL